MNRLLLAVALSSIITVMLSSAAGAGLLVREDFTGITPETFDGYSYPTATQTVDFGPFTLDGYWGTNAFSMPIAPPCVLPTIGGDTIDIILHPAVSRFGLDVGGFNLTGVLFYGEGDVLLASYTLGELFEDGSGPVGYQGFVGFEDDLSRAIHRVAVAPSDCYFDNLYFDLGPTGSDTDSWSSIKALYR